jgi:HEAT repeat protein
MTLDFQAALASSDVSVRLEAVAALARQPDIARPLVAALLVDPDAPVVARVWAMLTICLIKDDSQGLVAKVLVQSLNAVEGIVRRCAIETLGELKVDWAVAQIAEHLNDYEAIDGAWFHDDSTPSEAARCALESIGTPEAVRVLASHPEEPLSAASISARLRRASRAMRLLRSGRRAGASRDRSFGVTSDIWCERAPRSASRR